MNIPWTTLGTVLGFGILRGLSTAGATSAALQGGAPAKRATTIGVGVAVASAAACLYAGHVMNGQRKPNTLARGLMWEGGIGLGLGLPALVGALAAETSAPEAQPAKIGGPIDTDLVNDTLAAMRRQLG